MSLLNGPPMLNTNCQWTRTQMLYTFPVAGPRLWNCLPSNLRQSNLTFQQFCRALKTYLFGWLRLQHLVTFVFSVLYKYSYLLTCHKTRNNEGWINKCMITEDTN